MSRDLLTLEQAKRELRLLIGEPASSGGDDEADAFDPVIQKAITSASEILLGLYQDAASEFMDSDGVIVNSDGEPDIPGDVYSAAALMVHHLFEKPDDPGIPAGVMAIVNLRRTPSLA